MTKIWGICGMVLIQICYFPQLLQVLRTKEVVGLSWEMYAILSVGLVCYLIYSIKIKDWVYIIANILNLASSGILLCLILLYRR